MDNLIKEYPDGIFDMIFADPPYFLSNGGISFSGNKIISVNKGEWDKSRGIIEDYNFNLEWISYCQKLLKKDGTFWVTGTYHNIYSIGFVMQTLGMKIINNITWEKPNPPPLILCKTFQFATENIIWAAKNKDSKYFFNYEEMKRLNGGKQMRDIWKISIENSKNKEKRFGKHPTQKPVKLLERIILASTKEGDLIFDPFSGSSTTGVVAIRLNRGFVGCELEDEYIKLSINRLRDEIKIKKMQLF